MKRMALRAVPGCSDHQAKVSISMYTIYTLYHIFASNESPSLSFPSDPIRRVEARITRISAGVAEGLEGNE